MPEYKLTGENWIYRVDDDSHIPIDPENADYQEYMAWLTSGNTPIPADPQPVVIPTSVNMRQARLALLGAGLLATVDAALASMPGIEGEAARIEWEFAAEVRRYSPLVVGLSGALGWSEAQLDGLFVSAEAL